MATSSNTTEAQHPPRRTRRSGSTRRRDHDPRGAGPSRRAADHATTSTQPKTPVAQAQVIAERAVLVPVGASMLARENLVSTVKGFATRYRTRAGVERELKRYERRGATARNRFERQVRRTRTRFERELRQRRNRVERSVKQNRVGSSGRCARSAGTSSGSRTARRSRKRFVSDAQGRFGSVA